MHFLPLSSLKSSLPQFIGHTLWPPGSGSHGYLGLCYIFKLSHSPLTLYVGKKSKRHLIKCTRAQHQDGPVNPPLKPRAVCGKLTIIPGLYSVSPTGLRSSGHSSFMQTCLEKPSGQRSFFSPFPIQQLAFLWRFIALREHRLRVCATF